MKMRQTENRGTGLKVKTTVKQGQFILPYLGEVLTAEESGERITCLRTIEPFVAHQFSLREHGLVRMDLFTTRKPR
jgi:hypothetical protein